jgi:citrate lyase subunit beta/citryl-CoA lyase
MSVKHSKTPIAPLFVPGSRKDRFDKAAASGADAVILDLEDAVAPEDKEAARTAVATHGIKNIAVYVRVNARSSKYFEADLAALRDTPLSGIMLAKAQKASEIQAVHQFLGRSVPVIPLVETAAAFKDLAALLDAPDILQAAFGSLDFALDLGCQPSWDALSYARGQLVLASRLAGLPAPLDGVTSTINDSAVVSSDAKKASDLGFGGKLAIHPRQVAGILDAFHPDERAIAWALEVIAVSESGTVGQVDGKMVDRPVIELARKIMDRVPTGR